MRGIEFQCTYLGMYPQP